MKPPRYMYPPYPPNACPRQAPLEACPDLICRRSGQCIAAEKSASCRRLYLIGDEWRDQLASRLEALQAEWKANNPDYKFTGDIDERWRELRQLLQEGDEELMAETRRLFPEEFT
jgi:hypothetical protein